MNNSKRIKIGHIGTLHDHSSGKLECIKKFPSIFELVGVVAENKEQIEQCKQNAAYDGVRWLSEEELFAVPDLDAVLIETEELSLVKTAQKCIDRGLHVHMDKPAGESYKDFEHLLQSAAQKNLTVQLAYMYRYNPAIKKALEFVKNGKLGNIYQVEAVMNTGHDEKKREWLARFSGGIMFFLGCHMVDLALMFRGKPKKIVPYNFSSGFDGVMSLDNCRAVFIYDNGISLVESVACEINGFGRRRLAICGSRGSIVIEPLETVFSSDVPTKMKITTDDYAETFLDKSKVLYCDSMTGRYDEMMKEFAAIVNGEISNPFTFEYELLVQKCLLEACEII